MEECLEWSICSWKMEADIYILHIDGGVPEWSICSWRMEADIYILYIGGEVPGMEDM